MSSGQGIFDGFIQIFAILSCFLIDFCHFGFIFGFTAGGLKFE